MLVLYKSRRGVCLSRIAATRTHGVYTRYLNFYSNSRRFKTVVMPRLVSLLLGLCAFGVAGLRVAIIGGGVAGLSCAQELKTLGINPIVFDTGKRDVGGRCSTRNDQTKGVVFEHSAQVIVARDESFLEYCNSRVSSGELRQFGGGIDVMTCSPQAPSTLTPLEVDPRRLFVGSRGMQSLAEALSKGLDDVRGDTWVSSIAKVGGGTGWTLREAPGEKYDAVVIAHNGKCADNLMAKSTLGETESSTSAVHELLKVSFGATLRDPQRMRKMNLCSLYVLVFSGPKGLLPVVSVSGKDPSSARVVNGHPVLSWMCDTTMKLGLGLDQQGEGHGGNKEEHSYSLVSTREYGSANKVSQENIPPDKRAAVTSDMLKAAEELCGLPAGSITPSFSRLQLWGAAVPLNRHSAPCVWDGQARLAVCGDWFTPAATTRGPSIETAFLSGKRCAQIIARGLLQGQGQGQGQDSDDDSVGIESGKHNFVACLGSPLGDLGVSGGGPQGGLPVEAVEGPRLVFGNSPAKLAVAAGAGAGAGAAGAVGQKRWVKKT